MKLIDNLSRIPAADVKAGVAWATKIRKTTTTQNATWRELKDGIEVGGGSTACHGGMNMFGCDTVVTLHQWLNCPNDYGASTRSRAKLPDGDRTLTPEEGNAWSDWLFNRSWASAYFAAPSFEFARDIAVFFSTDLPANYGLALATLSRHGGEQRHTVRRWFDLLAAHPDMSEDLAYALAFGVTVTDSPYANPSPGHCTLYRADLAYIGNICNQKIVLTKGNARDKGSLSQGVQAMWGPGGDISKELERLVAGKIKADRVVIPNPFAPVIPSGQVSEALFQSAIPALIEMFPRRVEAQPKKKETEVASIAA